MVKHYKLFKNIQNGNAVSYFSSEKRIIYMFLKADLLDNL